jgi:hypothetical protein
VETSTSGLSYGSFVYPADRWAISVFRHQLGDLEARIQWSQGAFIDSSGNDFRIVPLDAALEMKIAGTGVSGAFKASDSIWLGAGLTYYQLDLSAYSNRYNAIWDFSQPNPWVLDYGLADFSEDNIVDHHDQSSDDNTWAVTLGGLWQQDHWSVGAVYRQGPDFSMDYRYVSGAVGQTANAAFGIDTAGLDASLTGVTRFHVPDVFGLGASYRPSEFSLISVELDWITYSDLRPSDNILVNLIDFFDPTFPVNTEELANFVVDDGLEIHLGGEYVFWSKVPLAVRAGLWYDPDHRMRYEGDLGVLQPRFRAGEDILHYSAGLGLVFPRIGLQVDGGVDYSDAGTVGSLSAVFSW